MRTPNIFRRWWDRQNERNAIKNDLIAFSKDCLLAVGRHVPDARRPRVRGVWYGDPTHSRIVWTDGAGRKWRWPLFILFSVCQKTPDERDLIIEKSLRNLLSPPPVSQWREPEFRTAEQVAQRLLALFAVVWRADEREDVAVEGIAWAEQNDVIALLSPAEALYLGQAQRPAHQDLVNFSWRAEAIVPLAWALGGMPELPPSCQRADIWAIPLVQVAKAAPADFVANACLRSLDEVADEEHRLQDEHWHVHDAQLRGRPTPAHLDAGVVTERRYALSWMVGYGESWDDVPVNT